MVLKKLISLLLLLTLQCSHTCYGQCTTFQFIGQPPANLNCNPFDTRVNPAVWRLRVLCTAERLSGSDEFEVHWFQRYINNTIKNHGRPEFRTSDSTSQTTYFGGQLINDGFSDNMLGDYWCQVIVNGMPTGVYSDGFTILRPEEYDNQLNTCSGILFDNSVSVCEDQPPASPPTITTSMPVAMTTTTQPLSPSLSGPAGMVLSETPPVATSPSHTIEVKESPSPKLVNTMVTSIPVTLTSTIVTLSSVPLSISIPISILTSTSVPISSTSMLTSPSVLISSNSMTSVPISSTSMLTSTIVPIPSTRVPPISSMISVMSLINSPLTNTPVMSTSKPIATHSTTTVLADTTTNTPVMSTSKPITTHSTTTVFADTTSTTNPLASQSLVEGQSNDGGSDLLILAVCMLIVMLILVIVLLVVIIVLLTWKRPRPRKTKVESGSRDSNFYRMSSVRSSAKHLLDDSRGFPDGTSLQMPYELNHLSENNRGVIDTQPGVTPPIDHRYSTISDTLVASMESKSICYKTSTKPAEELLNEDSKPFPSLPLPPPLLLALPTSTSEIDYSGSRESECLGTNTHTNPEEPDSSLNSPNRHYSKLDHSGNSSKWFGGAYNLLDQPTGPYNKLSFEYESERGSSSEEDTVVNDTQSKYTYIPTDLVRTEQEEDDKIKIVFTKEKWDYEWNPTYMQAPLGLGMYI